MSKILKSCDKTALENCIFISKSLKGLLPSIFNNWFKFSFETHSHDARWSNLGYLKMPSYDTKTYGRLFNVCKFNICLESLEKLPSKCYISSVESK